MLGALESKSMMKLHKSGGMVNWGRRSDEGGYTPQEGPSAGLSLLSTYLVWTVVCAAPMVVWMWQKMRFVCLFLLQPFHHPSTTPLLSP